MATRMNWRKVGIEKNASRRGAAKGAFEKERRAQRRMTPRQREYLNLLRERAGLEPIYTGLTIFEASVEIDRLKRETA